MRDFDVNTTTVIHLIALLYHISILKNFCTTGTACFFPGLLPIFLPRFGQLTLGVSCYVVLSPITPLPTSTLNSAGVLE